MSHVMPVGIEITVPYVRVYYNKGVEGKCWSLDFGPLTQEIVCREIVCGAIGNTQQDVNTNNTSDPRAWVEFDNVRVVLCGGNLVQLFPASTKETIAGKPIKVRRK